MYFVRCARTPLYIPANEVWSVVETEADHEGFDPEFVYSILMAESSRNAYADSGYARGIMQLTKKAWVTVSDEDYSEAWDWRKNIEAGVAYLAHCRDLLKEEEKFTYPLLAASYRFGPGYVEKRKFDIHRVRKPRNKIYTQLFAGDRNPVDVPG